MSLYIENSHRNNGLSAFILAACFVFPASLVNALGLGDITVDSVLNQPMDGKIKLTNLGSYDANDIRVKMASLSDFERSGVEMTSFLGDILFETVQDSQGGATISMSSEAPVQEPYLNFVVEAYWPDGRVLREYTVLLDLPLYAAGTQDTDSFKPAKSLPAANKAESAPARRFDPGMSGNSYTVGSEDTLWGIARKVTPAGATIQQTMIVIQQDNPKAFRNGNINQLRHGALLNLPRAKKVADLDGQTAIQEVRQQNQRWKSQSLTKVPLDASKSPAYAANVEPNTGGKLSLASGGTSSATSIGDSRSSNIDADLASTKEKLDEQSRANQALEARMVELQEQMGTLQTLIELKDKQIAQLQDSRLNDSASVIDKGTSESTVTVEDEISSLPPEEQAAEQVADIKPVETKPAITASFEEPSFIDIVMGNLTYIVAALLAVLLIVYFFIQRKNKTENETDQYADDSFEQEEVVEAEGDWNDFDAEDDLAATVDQSPVIAEAQVLINNGDIDKALHVLETAVGKEPHRGDIRLKHLEVLAGNNMAKQFKIHYMGLKAISSSDVIEEANKIVANTPGADSWLKEADDTNISAEEKFTEMDYDGIENNEVGFDITGDFDIDEVDDIEGLDMASISAGNTSLEEEGDIDLNLEEFDAEMDEAAHSISGLDEDLDNDFSQDLLATKEGGEGLNDLADLDDLLGNEVLDDSHEELSLDDGLTVDESDIDLTDNSIASLDELELDNATVDELQDDIGLDGDFNFDLDDDDLDDFAGAEDDDMGTRIELAKAYVELGDEDGAKEILNEVIAQGTDEQKAEAQSLFQSL
jgi:pilus assembly protein FimV